MCKTSAECCSLSITYSVLTISRRLILANDKPFALITLASSVWTVDKHLTEVPEILLLSIYLLSFYWCLN